MISFFYLKQKIFVETRTQETVRSYSSREGSVGQGYVGIVRISVRNRMSPQTEFLGELKSDVKGKRENKGEMEGI